MGMSLLSPRGVTLTHPCFTAQLSRPGVASLHIHTAHSMEHVDCTNSVVRKMHLRLSCQQLIRYWLSFHCEHRVLHNGLMAKHNKLLGHFDNSFCGMQYNGHLCDIEVESGACSKCGYKCKAKLKHELVLPGVAEAHLEHIL